MSEKENLSHSRLSTYADCGLKYHFRYNLKIPVVTDAVYFDYGNALHTALETFHGNIEADFVPVKDFLLQSFTDAWYGNVSFSEAEIDEKEIQSYAELGEKVLSEYYIKNINTPWFNKPLGVELPFEVPITNPFTGELITEQYVLYGVIDLLNVIDNTVWVLDHKTAKYQYKQDKIEDSMQLTLYYYVVDQLMNLGLINVNKNYDLQVAFNVFDKSKSPTFKRYPGDRDDQAIKRMLSIIKAHIHGVESKVFVPNFGSMWCKGCEFKEACDMWNTVDEKDWLDAFLAKGKLQV